MRTQRGRGFNASVVKGKSLLKMDYFWLPGIFLARVASQRIASVTKSPWKNHPHVEAAQVSGQEYYTASTTHFEARLFRPCKSLGRGYFCGSKEGLQFPHDHVRMCMKLIWTTLEPLRSTKFYSSKSGKCKCKMSFSLFQ